MDSNDEPLSVNGKNHTDDRPADISLVPLPTVGVPVHRGTRSDEVLDVTWLEVQVPQPVSCVTTEPQVHSLLSRGPRAFAPEAPE